MSGRLIDLDLLFRSTSPYEYFGYLRAALLQDGMLVSAAQEERFSRKKIDAGFAGSAIAYCLSEVSLRLCDLDYVVFYDKPLVKFERLLETY